MLPYGDNLTKGRRARGVLVLVGGLLLLNVPLLLQPDVHRDAVEALGFTPLKFSLGPVRSSYTLITATALHGDIFHLLGNCLFLVVFGRTLERLFSGRLLAAVFPALGVAGFLLHWVLFPNSPVPVIGCSGAVAALMGAYLPLFPAARIRVVLFFGWAWKRVTIPAWAFLPYWIGLQLLSLLVGSRDGVAYAVHAGSFAAGLIGAMIWKTTYPFADERLSAFTTTAFATASGRG